MGERDRVVQVRLTEEEEEALDKALTKRRKELAGHEVSRSDMIREAIAQCYIPRPRS